MSERPKFHNDRVFGMDLYRRVHDETSHAIVGHVERNVWSPVDEVIGDNVREQLIDYEGFYE